MKNKVTRKNVKEIQEKDVIFVFCEGESEQAYIQHLKSRYEKVVVIKKDYKGLFDVAYTKYLNDTRFAEQLKETKELWFFFDTEQVDREKWGKNCNIMDKLCSHNEKMNIRLLMTTGCVEYWFLLHFEKTRPSLREVPQKEAVQRQLCGHLKKYKKGDKNALLPLLAHTQTACENGAWCLKQASQDLDITQNRDEKLFHTDLTFTTVHEAVLYLENLLDSK